MSKDEMIYKLGELSRTPEHELISRADRGVLR